MPEPIAEPLVASVASSGIPLNISDTVPTVVCVIPINKSNVRGVLQYLWITTLSDMLTIPINAELAKAMINQDI